MVLLRDFSRFPFFAVHLCRSGKPSVTARAMNGTSRHQRQANRKNAVSDDPNEFEPTDTAYFFVYVCPVSHFRHGSLFLLAVSFRYGFSLGIFISICLCFRLPPFRHKRKRNGPCAICLKRYPFVQAWRKALFSVYAGSRNTFVRNSFSGNGVPTVSIRFYGKSYVWGIKKQRIYFWISDFRATFAVEEFFEGYAKRRRIMQ